MRVTRLGGDHALPLQLIESYGAIFYAFLVLFLLQILDGNYGLYSVFCDSRQLTEDLSLSQLRHELLHLIHFIKQLLHLLVVRASGGRAGLQTRRRGSLWRLLGAQIRRLVG